jgi:YidC/Oxa1 family membrane protein insertase
MNDIRRTILWVVFGFSLVMLWDQWQLHNGKKPTFFPRATPPVGASVNPATDASPAAVVTQAPAALPADGAPSTQRTQSETIEVQTNVLKLSFDSLGASLIYAELLKHKDVHRPGSNVTLIDSS